MQSTDVPPATFLRAYSMFLAGCAGNDHRDNYDWRRFGSQPAEPRRLKKSLATARRGLVRRLGYVRRHHVANAFDRGLRFAEPHLANLQWLYERLADEESREWLVQLVAYRALGHQFVKLPINRPAYWRSVEALERKAEKCETLDPNFLGWRLPKLDLREIGYPLELFCLPVGAVIQLVDQQYRCVTERGAIEAKEGEVVVDAGGCWGDTALFFSFKVGSQGKVYSFEFLPDNLAVFARNLELNPEFAARVKIMRHPVWSSSDEELFVSGNGPGTTVTPARKSPNDKSVRTMTIDQLVASEQLDRLDFVKMDIEGAELPALHGAEKSLREFRPRLAVTVYHSLSDFWEIPQYLDQLQLGYRFYLRHFTIHSEETVLFAESDGAA